MSSKNKMLVFGLHSASDDRSSNLSNECQPKCKKTEKGSHVIDKLNVHFWITFNFWWSAEKSEWWASTKMQKNEERPPMSSKNKMLVFGLRSTSDHWPSDLSIECRPKSKKNERRPPMSSKKKMLGFGLCSTSDNQPSDLSDKRWLKCGKRPPKSSKNEILIFILYSTSHNQTSDLSDESWSKCKKMTCCFS